MEPEDNNVPEKTKPSKLPKKEHLVNEAREVLAVVLYLLCGFSLLATIRGLVLIQQGIDQFAESYTMALIWALALSKVVAVAQKLPLLKTWDRLPLFWPVLYKAAVMTLIVDAGAKAEEHFFSHGPVMPPIHPLLLFVTHQIALLFLFIVLFTVRMLDRALGHGTLFRLFFFAPNVVDGTKSES